MVTTFAADTDLSAIDVNDLVANVSLSNSTLALTTAELGSATVNLSGTAGGAEDVFDIGTGAVASASFNVGENAILEGTAAKVSGLTVTGAGLVRVDGAEVGGNDDFTNISADLDISGVNTGGAITALQLSPLAAGQALTLTAAQASGLTIDGTAAGASIRVVDAVATTATDLQNFSGSDVTIVYGAAGTIASSVVQLDGADIEYSAASGTGDLVLTAAQADGRTLLGTGDFQVNGSDEAQTIRVAGNGNNEINTGSGADTVILTTTGGNQVVNVASGNFANVITATGAAVSYTINITGTLGFTQINASGSTQDLTVNAGTKNDVITGGSGNDTIYLGTGSDAVTGGAGNDTIYLGADSVSDQVTFASTAAGNGLDTIHDFVGTEGGDILDFSSMTLSGTGLGLNGDVEASQAIAVTAAGAASDWGNVLSVINDNVTSRDANGDDTVILVSNGTDIRAYYYQGQAGVGGSGGADIDATELTHIATLDGTAILHSDNILV